MQRPHRPRIVLVPPPEATRVAVGAPLFTTAVANIPSLPDGDVVIPIDLQVSELYVEGVVLDISGGPIEGARIAFVDMPVFTFSEDRGKFGLTADRLPGMLSVRASGYGEAMLWVDAPSRAVIVNLGQAAPVSGRVEDSQGVPVVGVGVVATSLTLPASSAATTDELGEFLLTDVTMGDTSVRVEDGGWSSPPQRLAVPSEGMTNVVLRAVETGSVDVAAFVADAPCSGELRILGFGNLQAPIEGGGISRWHSFRIANFRSDMPRCPSMAG